MNKKFQTLFFASISFTIGLKAQASASIDFPTDFAGLSTENPKVIISNIVQVVLGLLGVLTIVAIIYGGFLFMTANGDEKKAGSGKNAAAAGLIGLIIVLAAYAISSFVIDSLVKAV